MEKEVYKIERYLTEHITIDINHVREITQKYIDIDELKIYYVYALYKSENIDTAIYELKHIKNSKSFENNSFFLMVKSLLETDDISLIKKLESFIILDEDKTNKWLRLELFKLYDKKGIDYLAWKYLEEAISIDENFYEAILIRTQRLDLIENCSEIINQILQFPQSYINSDILNFLGNAFLNCNEIEDALKIFKGSLEICATEEANYFIGYIYHYYYNDYEKALNYYNQSISINKKFVDVRIEKAWLYYDIKEFENSEILFKKILLKYDLLNSYNQIILFYLKIKKYHEVLNYIEKSKNRFGENYMNLGFEIVYLQKINDNSYIKKYKNYKKTFTEEEIKWFKSLISEV